MNRSFSQNFDKIALDEAKYRKLRFSHFNPFGKKFREVKKIFNDARIVYIKFEFIEIIISIYFGGLKVLNKSVGGIHSPLHYPSPKSFFNYLHNILYNSFIYNFFLSRCKKIHVLNKRDEKYLKERFNSRNIYQIYDGVRIDKKFKDSKFKDDPSSLNIITVGELSLRKGTDILANIIDKSSSKFHFSIVGEGPLKETVLSLVDNDKCKYLGYIDNENELRSVYAKNDVLLFPSRAETLGLVMPEAMSCGLKVVNSKDVSLEMPSSIESSSQTESEDEYISLLLEVLKDKKANRINKEKIHKYAYDNFSNEVIYPTFFKSILEIKNYKFSK
jgi:glycosyltransferase involved in cell wall biosynthesis